MGGPAHKKYGRDKLRQMKGSPSVGAVDPDGRSCEYTVLQKIEGRVRLYRVLLVLGYILFSVGYFVFCTAIRFYPLACFTPLFTWIVVFFTWRYVSVAYRYEIVSGNWIFSRVLAERFHKRGFTLKIKDVERIAPYSDRLERSRVEAYEAEKTIFWASSFDSPDLHFALYTDSDGKRTVLYFEATRRSLQLLSYYNKNTVLSKVRY